MKNPSSYTKRKINQKDVTSESEAGRTEIDTKTKKRSIKQRGASYAHAATTKSPGLRASRTDFNQRSADQEQDL